MKIEYLGHSCFILEGSNVKILIDPFLSGNQLASKRPEQIDVDYIFLTHGHHDHFGDAIEIAKRTGAVVYAVVELAEKIMETEGIEVGMGNIGGKQKTPFGYVKYFPALHGSGIDGGVASGYIFNIGGKKVYHSGDTALIAEMQFLKDEKIDVALLPIGDFFTMGPEDALIACKLISPKYVIPMHYNTFPAIQQNPYEFKESVEESNICKVEILNPGESFTI
jgi:L-ascorbate metabolism protein UlaG (beta-lactamase superfamily)